MIQRAVPRLEQGEVKRPAWKTIRVLAGALAVEPAQLAKVLRKEDQ